MVSSWIEAIHDKELRLRLTHEELEDLPGFAYNDFLILPPIFSSGAADGLRALMVPDSCRSRATRIDPYHIVYAR